MKLAWIVEDEYGDERIAFEEPRGWWPKVTPIVYAVLEEPSE